MPLASSTSWNSLILAGGSATVAAAAVVIVMAVRFKGWPMARRTQNNGNDHTNPTVACYDTLIGHTPTRCLHRLSAILQRNIIVKLECCNPSGTGKDRAALGMLTAAERAGQLPKPITTGATHGDSDPSISCSTTATTTTASGRIYTMQKGQPITDAVLDGCIAQALQHSTTGGVVVEGTSGSTGIALATLCQSRGHACIVVVPDDQAAEKRIILQALGAVVVVVPTAAIAAPSHYVNVAQRIVQRANSSSSTTTTTPPIQAVFVNQFENLANFQTHYTQTGPEIYHDCIQLVLQSNHHIKTQPSQPTIQAFCMSAGTGGTIAGVGKFFKEQTAGQCRVVLVDPPGSVLYHKLQHGVAYTAQQAERTLRRHRYDTIAEGIGLDRLTQNVLVGLDYMDEAIRVSDQEAVDMAHWLLQHEGLWVGSSSAMNVVGAIRTALQFPPHSTIVTIICDSGNRHVTRFWNQSFCESWGLIWPQSSSNRHGTTITTSNGGEGHTGTNSTTTTRIPECLQAVYQRHA